MTVQIGERGNFTDVQIGERGKQILRHFPHLLYFALFILL